MNFVVIRNATIYDASKIARLLREWLDHTVIEYPDVDDNDFIEWISHTMRHGAVFVAEASGRLVGVIGVERSAFAWNRQAEVVKDQFFYVTPQHRGNSVASKLLVKAKAYSIGLGLPLFASIMSGQEANKLDRWYQGKGGVYLGGTFCFGVKEKVNLREAI